MVFASSRSLCSVAVVCLLVSALAACGGSDSKGDDADSSADVSVPDVGVDVPAVDLALDLPGDRSFPEIPSACDTCHGFPPPPPHVQLDDCNACHEETVNKDGSLNVASGAHDNGTVESSTMHPEGYGTPEKHGLTFDKFGIETCNGCHGEDLQGGIVGVSCEQCHPGFGANCTFCHGGTDNQTGAPPADLQGNTASFGDAVGAHTAHLSEDSGWHKAIACTECHVVPTHILDPGHADGGHGDLTWGPLASQGTEPVWETGLCESIYCHGPTLTGGTVPVPQWSAGPDGQADCGACHGLPPQGGPHANADDCSACHSTVMESATTFKNPDLHINGATDM